jgi:hypothetical protein
MDRFRIEQYTVEIEEYGFGEIHGGKSQRITRACGITETNTMPTPEEMQAEIERLRAENESLKKPARGQLSLRVSEKGALSVYGMGRFPVTLYREQWEKLLGMSDQIQQFIKDNDHLLKKKDAAAAE